MVFFPPFPALISQLPNILLLNFLNVSKLVITYHHHLSSSLIIITYHHHLSSSLIIITYHHHLSSSLIIIIITIIIIIITTTATYIYIVTSNHKKPTSIVHHVSRLCATSWLGPSFRPARRFRRRRPGDPGLRRGLEHWRHSGKRRLENLVVVLGFSVVVVFFFDIKDIFGDIPVDCC